MAERFDDLVPRWMLVVQAPIARAVAAVAIPALWALPLFLVDEPADFRPGPYLVIAVLAVAALAGWRACALAGLLVVLTHWWIGVPEARSFRLDDAGSTTSVVGMAVVVGGLVVLARRVEGSVADVRDLDARRRLHTLQEATWRLEAEQATRELSAVLSLSTTLAAASSPADVAAAALAGIELPVGPDSGSVALLEGVNLRVLASKGASPESIRALERVDISTSTWLGDVVHGTPALVDDREAFALSHPRSRVLSIYPAGSWAVIPFRSETTVGLLSLHYVEPQRLTAHAGYFSLVGEILASALERARAEERQRAQVETLEQAFAERDRIARTLSTTLLPPRLPQLKGFSAAAWILPASADQVAGDFYDLFAVDDGWVAVLGDVCGKGAEAAAVTSLARYAARVTALDDADPVHIAEVADRALTDDPSDLFCTMAVVRCRKATGELDVTLAGHPQPRLISNRRVQRVGAFASPLGLGGRPPTATRHRLDPGDSLVLFSDGMVERSSTFGEVELDEALVGCAGGDAGALAACLREKILQIVPDRLDDLAVLVITRDATT